MSYYNSSQSGYPGQHQYAQHPPTGPNGRAYEQSQPQYPGQPLYAQPGDNMYQTPGGYQEQPTPNSAYPSAEWGAQPQQQPVYQPSTYNPQHYAPPPPPQQQYNPQQYVQPGAGGSPYIPQQPQYNPAAYSEPLSAAPAQYGYSPGNFSTASTFSPHPQQGGYQYSPQPPSHQFGYQQQYQQPLPPPVPQRQQSQYGGTYQPQPPPPPPQSYEYQRHAAETFPASMPVPTQSQYGNISPALPGLNDPGWLPSPPQYHMPATSLDSRQSPSPLYHTDSHDDSYLPSPPESTPGPTPPAHGYVSRSNTNDRHPQARPLPGPPPEPDDYFDVEPPRNGVSGNRRMTVEEAEALSQEELFSQVEDAVLNAGSGVGRRATNGGRSPSISVHHAQPYEPAPLFGHGRNGSVASRHLSPGPATQQHQSYDEEAEEEEGDSDPEGAQGLAMLAKAEEEDRRRVSGGSQLRFSGYGGTGGGGSQRRTQQLQSPASDEDDYGAGAVDVSSFGGGYDVQMSYGGGPAHLAQQNGSGGGNSPSTYGHSPSNYGNSPSGRSSFRRSHASQSSMLSRNQSQRPNDYDYGMDTIHPFPPFNPAARVDTNGTGGLSEPTGRRQSYDEGDEYMLMQQEEAQRQQARFPDEPPEIFFRAAGMAYAADRNSQSGRPLPAPPPDEMGLGVHSGGYPVAPGDYAGIMGLNAQGQWVPRSTSLVSHSSTPLIMQPLRAKTDAEEQRRLRQAALRGSAYSEVGTPLAPSSAVTPDLDLPSLGAKKFLPSKLGATEFRKCEEPWALSALLDWLQLITGAEQVDLREMEIKEALTALFTSKVPTMNIADAEGLAANVAGNMFVAGALVRTEEWVRLVPGAQMSGVVFQLTGTGCYAPTIHDHLIDGRCYAHHCQRTLKKVNLSTYQPVRNGDSWAEFYGLKKEDLEGKDRKELDRQNNLYEIVISEDLYMQHLDVVRILYRDGLAKSEPSIISPKRRERFLKDVFGRIDAVKIANEEHLLPQLKYRQQEQGPWVVGFSDLFRQWIRKAKGAYIAYASEFPRANFAVRQEIDRNLQFREFIEKASKDKRSSRLSWDTFLGAPIKRLQRYGLLIDTVIKNTREDSEERRNLQVALAEVKAVTSECDTRVAEMQRKVDLKDLEDRLVLRPGMQGAVELNLDHFGRELFHRGDLQRMGESKFTWLEIHALLFDHYLVLAKTVAQRSEGGGRQEKYDVSRLPIPMDLLVLESKDDLAVQKSTYVKGITSVTTVTGRGGPTAAEPGILARANTAQGGSGVNGAALQQINTAGSSANLQTVASLGESKDTDKIMYPFKLKHLGKETYVLFAPSEKARSDWCAKIVEAKTKHAAALYAQHAEPFRLRVMADSAFVYDAFGQSSGAGGKSVVIKGSPVDRAIAEVELRFKGTGRPGPICRARVNCATTWCLPSTPQGPGRAMVAVGTDFGVFISDVENPRGWSKVCLNVTTCEGSRTDLLTGCTDNTDGTSNASRRARGLQPLPPHRRQIPHRLPPRHHLPVHLRARRSRHRHRRSPQSAAETLRQQRRRLLRHRPHERPHPRLLQKTREPRLRVQSPRAHLPEIQREETRRRHVQTRHHRVLPRVRRILHPRRMHRHEPLPLLAGREHGAGLRGAHAG